MRLKDIGYLYSGLTGKSGDDFQIEDPTKVKAFVPFTNIFNNTKIDTCNFCHVRMEDGEVQNRVQTGDLLFLMSSEDYESIGKPAVVSDPVPELYLNSFCRGLRVTRRGVCSEYVNYYLGAEEIREAIRLEARGFTRVNLKIDRLAAQNLELPSLAIQRRIVNYLDEKTAAIDARITMLEKKIAAYRRLRASIINHTVTCGLDSNVRMKDSGVDWIGKVPDGWDVKRIKSLVNGAGTLFVDGDWINSEDIENFGIRYYTSGNIGQGVFKEQGNGYISEATFRRLKCLPVRGGDILISRLNLPIGRACILPMCIKKCVVAVDCVVFRPDSRCDKRYLVYAMSMNSYLNETLLYARGTTMQRITRTQLSTMKLPVPPLEEQKAIADYLDAECAKIDRAAEIVAKQIDAYKRLKRSLINEVVTGKRKVA